MGRMEKLEKEVIQRFKWDDRIDDSQIDVSVIDNTAILRGCVNTYPEKILAEIETQFIPEIKSVKNEIEIKFPESYENIKDKEVEDAVFCLLNANSEIDSNNIGISIENGNVSLEGRVNSYWKKDKIRNMASQVKGVVSISDNIAVVPDEKITDDEIEELLKTAMANSVHIDANKVSLKINNGIVELSGILPSMSSYNAVIKLVRSTKGVVDIKDDLKWVLRYKTT
jgi:osmotically-inducible protein OsmY